MLNAPAARILVIDDEPVVVDMLVTCLREEGYRVVGAETSDEGLKLAILSRPELVLLDIALPGMNGIELLKRIRSINPTTRVIMVTGNTDPALARAGPRSQAAAPPELLAHIEQLRRQKPRCNPRSFRATLRRGSAQARNAGMISLAKSRICCSNRSGFSSLKRRTSRKDRARCSSPLFRKPSIVPITWSGLPVMTWWRSPSAPTYASIDFVPISAGLKQASVIFLPPLIARILSAPSPSSSFETAQGNHPSAIRATRLTEG